MIFLYKIYEIKQKNMNYLGKTRKIADISKKLILNLKLRGMGGD
jgi:hypothetical protein